LARARARGTAAEGGRLFRAAQRGRIIRQAALSWGIGLPAGRGESQHPAGVPSPPAPARREGDPEASRWARLPPACRQLPLA